MLHQLSLVVVGRALLSSWGVWASLVAEYRPQGRWISVLGRWAQYVQLLGSRAWAQ